MTLFLGGDVMTGRGIDQILPHPGDPQLYEPYLRSALGYVQLAREASGALALPVDFGYIWGDALAEFEQLRPAARIVNLETAITRAGEPWPGKGIHYRMHPANVPCLGAAGIDCCTLANNHVLDWGYAGLLETLVTLRDAGIAVTGAGTDATAAAAPAVLTLVAGKRALVFACAAASSGVPAAWNADSERPGLAFLPDLSLRGAEDFARRIQAARTASDRVVVSIHWGANWSYDVPADERRFAHALIDAGVDIVHGHSSHHPRGIEVYRDKLVLYGCGDLLNDYEGIGGHEMFRPGLGLLYFARIEAGSGRLLELRLTPVRIHRFRIERAAADDAQWLAALLTRLGAHLGTRAEIDVDGRLRLRWDGLRDPGGTSPRT